MSQKVLSFHYVLTGQSGEKIDASEAGAPLSTLAGSGQIIPGLEEEIVKMKVGDKKKIFIPAAKAYGVVNEALIHSVERSKLPEGDIQVGVQFRGGEEPQTPVFTVVKIEGEKITLDGNHPLAGKDLNFEIEMVDIREATKEELKHGHVHGPGGHEH